MKKTIGFILLQIFCFVISLLISSFFILLWCFVSWENKFIDTNGLEILRLTTVLIYTILSMYGIVLSLQD